MKKLILLLLIATLAYGKPKESIRPFIESNGAQNMLRNPGFESDKQGWSLVLPASTFSVSTAAGTVGVGKRTGSFDSGGFDEHFESDLEDIPARDLGAPCSAKIDYLWNGTNGDLTLKVLNHGDVEQATLDLSASTVWQKSAVYFRCPTAGALKIRIATEDDASVNPAAILIDSAWLGQASSIPVEATFPMRMCIARVVTGSAPTITYEENCLESATGVATGRSKFFFRGGFFSDTPNCVCNVLPSSGLTQDKTCSTTGESQVSFNITTINADAPQDEDAQLICVGPKGTLND